MSSLQGLAIKADGYTYFAVVLLAVDFVMVQSHFVTMLKYDQSASDVKIKVFSILSILFEFLVLTPLFFINSLDIKGGICIVLVPTAFIFVSLFCFTISLTKTWLIHNKMVSEGKIASHSTHLKVGAALIMIGYIFTSFLGSWAYFIELVGLCIYLYVLNIMRKNNGPVATSRIFWSQIASFAIGILIMILAIAMVYAITAAMASQVQSQVTQNGGSTSMGSGTSTGSGSGGFPGFGSGTTFSTQKPVTTVSTQQPQAVASDTANAVWDAAKGYLVAIVFFFVVSKYVTLITTGHFIGDACSKTAYHSFDERIVDQEDNSTAAVDLSKNTAGRTSETVQ
jgi:hypothetical protein